MISPQSMRRNPERRRTILDSARPWARAGRMEVVMLYVVFIALDGRELYACAAADMLPDEKRAIRQELAAENGIKAREIYITHAVR